MTSMVINFQKKFKNNEHRWLSNFKGNLLALMVIKFENKSENYEH